MPIRADIEIKGERQVLKRLDDIEKRDAKKALRRGFRAGAKVIQRDAKSRVRRRTGTIRATIKVRAMRRSRTRMGIVIRTGTRKELGVPEDSKGYGPAALEYGYQKPGGSMVPAYPYMRPAFLSKAKEAKQAVIDSLRADLRL